MSEKYKILEKNTFFVINVAHMKFSDTKIVK